MPADFITTPLHFSYLCSSHQKKVSDTIREQMCIHVHANTCTHTHTPEWQQWFEFDDEVCLRIEINGKQNQKIHSRLTLFFWWLSVVDNFQHDDWLNSCAGLFGTEYWSDFADLYWKYWCWYIVILFIIHIFDDIKITSCVELGLWCWLFRLH